VPAVRSTRTTIVLETIKEAMELPLPKTADAEAEAEGPVRLEVVS